MIEIALPAMGEGIIEAEITRWLVREGDPVNIDEPVVEVATDKVDSEVVSPAAGILHKILLEEGDVAKVGQVLAVIRVEDGIEVDPADPDQAGRSEETTAENSRGEKYLAESEPMDEPEDSADRREDSETVSSDEKLQIPNSKLQIPNSKPQSPNSKLLPGQVYLSPQVKKTIREYRLSQSEISSVRGTGKNGRITHRDLMEYISGRKPSDDEAGQDETSHDDAVRAENGQDEASLDRPAPPDHDRNPESSLVNISREMIYGDENNEVVEMDRMRRLIADHMVYSASVSPHVTSFVEADVTDLVTWREKVKYLYLEKYGQKLTYTPLIIEAVVKAINEFPRINVSLDGYRIIQKKQVNIGMATALPSGNLIVPVIRDANKKNLQTLVREVNELASRARNNKLKPDEIQGSTFSVTNMGQFGNISGTPIINQPEVAILAVGTILKKPAVVGTPDGDAIGIRNIVILSLSYDHRVVDGLLGGSFLKRIGEHLENNGTDREI